MNEVKLLEMIEKKEYVKIKERLSQMNEVDVADLLDPLDENTTLSSLGCYPRIWPLEYLLIFLPSSNPA